VFLEQHTDARVGALVEGAQQRGPHALQSVGEARTLVRADVRDDGVGAELFGRRHGADQRDHRILVEVLLGARQVDEVDGVDDHEADGGRGAGLPEARRVPLLVHRRRPGAGAAGEELNGLAAQLTPWSMAFQTPPPEPTCAPKYMTASLCRAAPAAYTRSRGMVFSHERLKNSRPPSRTLISLLR